MVFQLNGSSIMNIEKTLIISKSIAVLLKLLQIFEYVVPILYFILRLFLKKEYKVKSIVLNIFSALIIYLAIVGIGNLILNNSATEGYSSKTMDYFKYNGEIVYYHK